MFVVRPSFPLLVLALMACASAVPPRQPSPLAASLDANAPQWLAQYDVPGIAVAYVRDGSVAWTRVYGEQSPGVPATPRTLYNLASLTKPLFAEVVLRLCATGKLSLDEPVSAHWIDPDVRMDPRHQALTLRHLLSHRGGFANWRRETGGTLKFESDPGATYRYSGEGFEYARRFVERKLGASLDSLSRLYVLGPLGMRNTSFVRRDWFEGRVALPRGSEGKYGESDFSAPGLASDNAYTTIEDYGAFLGAVMNRTGLPRSLARQRDSVHAVEASGAAVCPPKLLGKCPELIGYGLGWSVLRYTDHDVLWHTGSDWGEKAMVFYFPEKREGVVMLSNGANGFQLMIDIGTLLFENTDFAAFLAAGR